MSTKPVRDELDELLEELATAIRGLDPRGQRHAVATVRMFVGGLTRKRPAKKEPA